jgi:hypothetical protein
MNMKCQENKIKVQGLLVFKPSQSEPITFSHNQSEYSMFTARLESLEIARQGFQKFNSKYIESIKIARWRYPPRDTNFPHWVHRLTK